MAATIASAMLTELRGKKRVIPVLKVTIGSEVYQWAKGGASSGSAGNYLDRIESWGNFSRPSGFTQLEQGSGSATVRDVDEVIGKQLGGRYRGEELDWTVEGWLRSDHVDAADHFRFMDGVITDWNLSGPRLYDFEFGPDLRALEAEENNIPKIARTEWPNAPKASLGLPGQVVYNKHNSAGVVDAAGLVKCIPVETDNNWWYVSIGKLESGTFNKAYRSGTDATSDFAMEYKLRSGTFYTIVRDTAGTSDQESDTVHVDISGVETDGDGLTGSLITAPVPILEHFLANFVWGKYPENAVGGYKWLVKTTAPINTTYFNETGGFLDDRDYSSARVLKTTDRGIDVLNDWCDNHEVSAFWSADWTLGIRPFNHAALDIDTGRMIRPEQVHNLASQSTTSELRNKISVQYFLDSAANTLREGPITIQDSRQSVVLSRSIQQRWGEASKII